jgi:hypothetical protein
MLLDEASYAMMEPSTVSPLLHVIRRMVWLATAITVISCAVLFVQLWRWDRAMDRDHRLHYAHPRLVTHHGFAGCGPMSPASPRVTTQGSGSVRLARLAVAAHLAGAPAPTPPAVTAADVADPHAAWSALGLTQLDAKTFVVDRALAAAVMTAPLQAMRGERIIPTLRGGHRHGFKLFHLSPDSALTAIGLHDGDTLLAINDIPLFDRDSSRLAFAWRTEAVYRVSFETRDGRLDVRNLVFR